MTDIYLIRHGRTDWNAAHRLQGQTDIPLNAEGLQQAEAARKLVLEWGVRFDRVYSSPLERAVETAAVVSGFPPSDVRTDDRLKEIRFGVVEGSVYEELSPAFRAYIEHPWENEPVPGIETAEELIERLRSFLRSLKDELIREDPEGAMNVLVATHGMALHALLAALPGPGRAMWEIPLGNCVIFRTSIRDGSYTPPERLTEARPTFE